jgi:hypothetical protein
MFILESSQTPLHQTCLAGNLQPDLYKSEQSNLSNLAINNCIFMVKHCQVPHLLPIEKAHLRAGRVSYRSALLAVLCPHKGKHMSWPVDSGMLEFLPSHPPLPFAAAGVVRVGCDYADSVADPQQQWPVVLGWSIISQSRSSLCVVTEKKKEQGDDRV